MPIFLGALMATAGSLSLIELTPKSNAKRLALLEEKKFRPGNDRFNFAHASDQGRVYKVASLIAERTAIEGLEIERKGSGPDYPTYVVTADNGSWKADKGWTFHRGSMHIVPDSVRSVNISFDSLYDRHFHEPPRELLAAPKSPQDMGYRDLTRFILALQRSGGDTNELRVERALKRAVPVTCFIIALFGAPLATSTQRGGAAYGIGVSLATTVVFLVLIQLTKAIGGKGLVPPDLAAWIPNIAFGIIGLVMLARVRT
jgi:lipopolysaccharide export system permease protein